MNEGSTKVLRLSDVPLYREDEVEDGEIECQFSCAIPLFGISLIEGDGLEANELCYFSAKDVTIWGLATSKDFKFELLVDHL